MPWTEKLLKQSTTDSAHSKSQTTYTAALNEALSIALDTDKNVFVLGQGVDDPSGMFGVTKDLHLKHGRDRVFDTPLSEDAITGICTGAAMAGMRPVYFHNRPDFLLLTFNQIVNHASKMHWLDCGTTKVPWVIWAAIGRGWGSGAQHSQAIQGLLMSVPGLKIVMPSTPYDAKGLLLSSIIDNNPVIIFEHRWTMRQSQDVPTGFYTVPIGKGVRRREGSDISIIGTSHALELATSAADQLEQEMGLKADVIDLRTIKPFDRDLVIESVMKTKRCMVVDTGWSMGGVCAELSAFVHEHCFASLAGPVKRVGLPDLPAPAGYSLEQCYFPDIQLMKKEILSCIDSSK